MKEFWLKKEECTGCGGCYNICPKQAIQMNMDECGFQYPNITDICIDCDLCEKVCKARRELSFSRLIKPDTYAVWSKNEKVRYKSTSGGAFTELAKIVLNQSGFVVGAQYREDNFVEHVCVSDNEGLARIRQSKYIQSDIGNIYKTIKEKLKTGKLVAFCGAPCQVAALYAYLGKMQHNNLITFDFICRGMNSPKAYRSWLDEIEQTEASKITRVWFKYKDGGWNTSPRRTRIDFADGRYIVKEQEENLFMHGYLFSNLYIRPSCGKCEFKGIPRQGDITLADFWGLEKKLDDDKGSSMLLINSEKGRLLFEQAKENLNCYQRDFSEIFAGNSCFYSSVTVPKNGEKFLRDLDNGKFSDILKKYTRVPLWKKIFRKIKMVIKKTIGR